MIIKINKKIVTQQRTPSQIEREYPGQRRRPCRVRPARKRLRSWRPISHCAPEGGLPEKHDQTAPLCDARAPTHPRTHTNTHTLLHTHTNTNTQSVHRRGQTRVHCLHHCLHTPSATSDRCVPRPKAQRLKPTPAGRHSSGNHEHNTHSPKMRRAPLPADAADESKTFASTSERAWRRSARLIPS
jgi:hypothetical protein